MSENEKEMSNQGCEMSLGQRVFEVEKRIIQLEKELRHFMATADRKEIHNHYPYPTVGVDYGLKAEPRCPYCNLPMQYCKGHTIS